MSNNWAYSGLGQRERLKLIREGNDDVYNAEKSNNKKLKNERESLGLDTGDIDNWDKIIDYTHSSAKKKRESESLPKFTNDRLTAVNKAFKQANDDIKAEKQRALKEAEDAKEKDYEYLLEWLANNGFSDEGSLYKKSKKEHEEYYDELVESINKEYEDRRQKARQSHFGAYLG